MNKGENVRKWREQFNGAKLDLPERKAPYIVGDIEPYTSPIDNRVISSRKDHREDLRRNGCRVYEGREQEVKVAQQHRAAQDEKFEQRIGQALEQTAAELKDGRTKKEAGDKPIPFTFGL